MSKRTRKTHDNKIGIGGERKFDSDFSDPK